jgi:ABC-type nitrate/sulfonate/bicarbonate transport system permease component
MTDQRSVDPVWSRLCRVLVGIGAVVWLVLGAAWELVTAALGIRPSLLPVPRYLAHVIGEEYRSGRDGWIDGEIVDNTDLDVEP